MARATRCRLLASLLTVVATIAACSPAPGAPSDTIVLLGGRVFDGSARCATLLDELAGASGVFGDEVDFACVGEPGDTPAELVERLSEVDGVRAVVAIFGDLALMHEVDPNRAIPPLQVLTSREIDEAGVLAAVDALVAHCAENGAALVLCTPPLGMQGRVEVPELLALGGALRRHASERPTLDLTRAFREVEERPLFEQGIDRLGDDGHDVLARVLFDALRLEARLPARDDAERDARMAWDALLSWAAGEDDSEWLPVARKLLERRSHARRGLLQRAVLSNLVHGLQAASRQRWRAIDPGGMPEPVLAVGRALCGDAIGELPGAEPLIAHMLSLLEVFHGEPEGPLLERGDALVAADPARVAPWIALEAAARITNGRRGVPRTARAHLRTFAAPPITLARVEQLMASWPDALAAAPAVLLVEHGFRSFLPVGEALDRARRQARVGMVTSARRQLRFSLRRLTVPASWQAELDALDALRDR